MPPAPDPSCAREKLVQLRPTLRQRADSIPLPNEGQKLIEHP